VYMSICKT